MSGADVLSVDLPAEASSPRTARHSVAEWIGNKPRLDELLLCVSEVVTNAVLHARTAVQLRVDRTNSTLRVEVHDDDPAMPVRKSPAPSTPTGRGLLLLDRLTESWGATPAGDGKVVWFTFDVSKEPA